MDFRNTCSYKNIVIYFIDSNFFGWRGKKLKQREFQSTPYTHPIIFFSSVLYSHFFADYDDWPFLPSNSGPNPIFTLSSKFPRVTPTEMGCLELIDFFNGEFLHKFIIVFIMVQFDTRNGFLSELTVSDHRKP